MVTRNKLKTFVLIDGSNFYFKLKDLKLNNLLNFDFSEFVKLIGGDRVVKAVYYVGKVSTDGTARVQRLFNNQRRLLSHLKKNGLRYSLGYLMKNEGKYHEKGVDVNMAIDILVSVYEDLCDRIVLVSSDTDLLPAVARAIEKGKIVEYVGFSHKPSKAMIANSSVSVLLKMMDLKNCLLKKALEDKKNLRRPFGVAGDFTRKIVPK